MTALDEIRELREACGYDPEQDGSVDDLIGYKDALEEAYGTLFDAAKAHLEHTSNFCGGDLAEIGETCPTWTALKAAAS